MIKYKNWFEGLSGLGKMEQGKFPVLTNCEIHEETGLAMPQYAMESESTTPNEVCFSAIVPTGEIYFCSASSGKIWKRTDSGTLGGPITYSLVHTNTNGTHAGCQYFNGYLWYWGRTKLGHFNLASTWTDSFGTFKAGNASGSEEINNTLVIGDGRYLARIDAANSFDDDAFTVPAQYNITDVIGSGDDLLIGTRISAGGTGGGNVAVAQCKVFLWDTVSPLGWVFEDTIFETGVNSFMRLDNIIVAQCGTGKFYYWTGREMDYFGKIKNPEAGLTYGRHQLALTYNGRPMIAFGTKIYSIHREDRGLPMSFCCEYTATANIGSLAVYSTTLLASTSSGVEKRGSSFATAVIETPEAQENISKIEVEYDEYPAGIGISTKVNGGDWTVQTPKTDSNLRVVSFDGGLLTNVCSQARITLTPSGSDRPKIKSINFK